MKISIKNIGVQVCIQQDWCNPNYSNDKRKSTRRHSFYHNGWEVPIDMKNSIKTTLQQKLVESNISFISIDWVVSESFRGNYDKLVVITNL